MNKKGKQIELSAAQLSKLAKLTASFNSVAGPRIDKKIGNGNGETNSIRTQKATREVMKTAFRRLYELGFQIEEFKNLQSRHIEQLVLDWHASGIQPKTINNYLSVIRKCGGWIGKTSLVPSSNALVLFLPNVDKSLLKVSSLAASSKSWSEQGIDVIEKIKQADEICIIFGAMLRLALAFGFRRKEQIRCIPSKIDGGDRVMLRGNVTKSGRDRDIEIVHQFQRYALDHAKRVARRGFTLGWPGKTYAQSVNHYNYFMGKKLGITGKDADCVGHGLRAEFSENLALLLGFVPATLGGAPDQLPSDRIKQIQSQVTRAMGHNRLGITGAYYGSLRLKPRELGPKVCSLVIGDGIIVGLHINPFPTRDETGDLRALTTAQRDRSVVHLQIERDGQIRTEGRWQISGYSVAFLEHVDMLDAVQRKLLSDKLQAVLGKIGWDR